MATFKVPYTYTSYSYSKWATRVDKFCHAPSSCGFVIMTSFLLFAYFFTCFTSMGLPEAVLRVLGYVAAVLLVIVFIGAFFLGLICDKLDLSERVAEWEICGLTPKAKKVFITLGILLILPGVIALAVNATTTIRNNAYHNTMVALENPDSIPVKGNMAVTFEDDRFTRSYVPDSLRAGKPEDVRYIIYCTDGEELVGFYGFSAVGGYKRWRKVEVVDRENGNILGSEIFYGSEPPSSISDDDAKKQYGSEPDDALISEWVKQTLPGA